MANFETAMIEDMSEIIKFFLDGQCPPDQFITSWNSLYYLLVHEWHSRDHHKKWLKDFENWKQFTNNLPVCGDSREGAPPPAG